MGLAGGFIAGDIGENHDRKFETLGAMHGHDSHALGAFLDHRRFAGLLALGPLLEVLDEAAHRSRRRRAS